MPDLRFGPALVVALLSASCRDSSPPPAVASGTIGAAGGTLAVTTGILTGTTLSIPAGALTADVVFEIRESSPSIIQGGLAVGPAAEFDPKGTALAQPATLKLLFDPMLVPSVVMTTDFRVPYRDPFGTLRVATPSTIDTANGTVTVDTSELGTFWVAVPDQVRFRDYYPLNVGDTYRYTSGLQLVVSQTTSEPNFGGMPLLKLTYTQGTGRFFGEYYTSGTSGELTYHGEFDITFENLQERVDGGALLWNEVETVGVPKTVGYTFTGYRPYGFIVPNYAGTSSTDITVTDRTTIGVPAGSFSDVIVSERIDNRQDTRPRTQRVVTRMWLANGVGPVQILFDDGSVETLLSATVGGMSIP